MEHEICSLREMEKSCRNDIRYIYLLDDIQAPSFTTFGNIIRNQLTDSIEQLFKDIFRRETGEAGSIPYRLCFGTVGNVQEGYQSG
nr:transposase [Lactonifactor longoviformis]